MIILTKRVFYNSIKESTDVEINYDSFSKFFEEMKRICAAFLANGGELEFGNKGYFVVTTTFPKVDKINFAATRKLWEEDRQAYIERRKAFYDKTKPVSGLKWIKNKTHWATKRFYGIVANKITKDLIKQKNASL